MTNLSRPSLQDNEVAARDLLSAAGVCTAAGALALAILNGDIPTPPPSPRTPER